MEGDQRILQDARRQGLMDAWQEVIQETTAGKHGRHVSCTGTKDMQIKANRINPIRLKT